MTGVPSHAINQAAKDADAEREKNQANNQLSYRADWVRKAALSALAGGQFFNTKEQVEHLGQIYDWIRDDHDRLRN
jgi:hypothetical protein